MINYVNDNADNVEQIDILGSFASYICVCLAMACYANVSAILDMKKIK